MSQAELATREEIETWCPMCGQRKLLMQRKTSGAISFLCPDCCPIGGLNKPQLWQGISRGEAILEHLLTWLGDYYWQAIETGRVSCRYCAGEATIQLLGSQDIPEKHSLAGVRETYGIELACAACQRREINTFSHLALDLPEVRSFWLIHPRMRWEHTCETEYARQPAIRGRFQSVVDDAHIDIICQRETLAVLVFSS